jgi:hypothetical protein
MTAMVVYGGSRVLAGGLRQSMLNRLFSGLKISSGLTVSSMTRWIKSIEILGLAQGPEPFTGGKFR